MLRTALLILAVLAAAPAVAAPTCSGPITSAEFGTPTGRYPHGVLGDDIEWGSLKITCGDTALEVLLPEVLVFEDTAPRLADLDGDGTAEVVVVESHSDKGARLAVWGLRDGRVERVASTPHIGTRFRWLAPVGIADLDADGAIELAYVDRPHLARVLRVWRYSDGKLTEIASQAGYTNHRIGERDIAGGIRQCGDAPEMLVATADWRRIHAVRLTQGALVGRDIGPHRGRGSFRQAMNCR